MQCVGGDFTQQLRRDDLLDQLPYDQPGGGVVHPSRGGLDQRLHDNHMLAEQPRQPTHGIVHAVRSDFR
jgi:hypothetical protein